MGYEAASVASLDTQVASRAAGCQEARVVPCICLEVTHGVLPDAYCSCCFASFLILIARFVTLDAWSVQEPHTHAPCDEHGKSRTGRRGVSRWRS